MQLTTQDGHILPLRPGESTLGRGADNTIVVPNLSVSRRHASLSWDGAMLYVSDNASANGTWLDGRRLPAGEWTPVRPGAAIRFGDDLYVHATPAAAPGCLGATMTAPPPIRAPQPLPSPVYAAPAPAFVAPAPRSGTGRGGLDLLLAAVDVSLSRNKLIVALGGSIVAGVVLGLAMLIAIRIALDGPVVALLFAALGAILAWLAITLTIGALTRMSLNDLAGRPPLGKREALQYAVRRWPEFALAPLALASGVALVVLAEVVIMLIGRIDYLGELVASILFLPGVVLNLFVVTLLFFGGSLLFPIIVDRGRGVFGALSYLLTVMRRTPGRVVFYLGTSVVVTWLATLVLWLLVISALGLTTQVLVAGMGVVKSGAILGTGLLGQLPSFGGGLGSLLGGMFNENPGTYTVAGWLLQLGALLPMAVAVAFPMVLQVAMSSAVYLNVKDEVAG